MTDAYEHEMTMDDHAALLELIRGVRGAVAISSYPSPFYERTLAGWERRVVERANHSGQGRTKERRLEVLWIKGPRSR